MNSITLIGRLTTDPEMRKTPSDFDVARFVVAVDRINTKPDEKKTDFIPCVAYGKTAIVIGKWVSKGTKVGITGTLNIDNKKTDDGNYLSFTKVVVNMIDLLSSKKAEEDTNANTAYIPDEEDENVPF